MKKVESEKLINNLEDRVELHLKLAIEEFQNLEEELLLAPANDNGWSIAQCLEHLNRYGNYYLPQIEEAMVKKRHLNPAEFFKSSWAGNYFTKMMEPETGKKKIKAFKNYRPERELEPHSVVAEFIHQQEKLLKLLNESRNKNLNKIKIPVSIAKWMKLKLGDVFQFLIAHNERHIKQALRVMDQKKINSDV